MRNPIKEMRDERGLSVSAFAHILGVNEGALRLAESGQTKMPARTLAGASAILSVEKWHKLQQDWLDYQRWLEQRRLKALAAARQGTPRLTLSPKQAKAWPRNEAMPRNSLNPFYKYRMRRGMTLGAYADLLDVSRGALSIAERDGAQMPSHLITALCDLENLNYEQVAEDYRKCRQHRREDALSLLQDGGV